jgi:aspartate kinase
MSSPLAVLKFGGTSVGSADRIRSVAERIARLRSSGEAIVVVVSAMGHTTDELMKLAHEVSPQPPGREMDMLLTVGERISMALLSMALQDLGVPALSLTGSQSGILTTNSHRRARILRILGTRIRENLAQGKVVIVAGFQGMSEQKEITTLGRGGSDTTAVALSAVLGASRCDIYTDVDGVMSADPRIVPDAKLYPYLPLSLMSSMAMGGAGVLHPRCVDLALQYQVPLRVLSSSSPLTLESKGTELGEDDSMEEFQVTAVTSDLEKVLLEVEFTRPGLLKMVADFSREKRLVLYASEWSAEPPVYRTFVEKEALGEWTKWLESSLREGFLKRFSVHEDWVPLTVIGTRFAHDGGALAEMFELLDEEHISVRMGSGLGHSLVVGVPRIHASRAVLKMHDVWIAGKRGS